ncbi:pilus assembly protein N-terminal domain-containing protein [Gallaecimonas sp. GXIMD4217]|uniref:type II and III secretion system protein family protein n=1 Tax=Gallaecimonas sp. GXIMD4217 TaxID=3131927 RepID=UPI00311B1A68
MKRIFAFLWLALAGCLLSPSSQAHYNKELQLYVGAVELYKAADVQRVVIGNESVVSAKVLDDKHVVFIGGEVGAADVQLWRKDGKVVKLSVVVAPKNDHRTIAKVRKLLSPFKGLSVREEDGMVVVEGDVDIEHKKQLKTIFEQTQDLVSLVRYRDYGKGEEPMVRMDVKIVEISKSNLRNIGVRWGDAMDGPAFGYAKAFSSNPIFSVVGESPVAQDIAGAIQESIGNLDSRGWSYFGLVTGISSQINLMAEQGEARMLAQPNLATRSGESASFLAGGEFPIPVINSVGATSVEFKEYGIKLDIEPNVDGQGNIISHVKAEVSSIDPSLAVDDIPAMLTRRTESVINVKDNETMVISGLVNSEMSKTVSKFPFLGDIPVLGELFKSRDFRDKKTEMVIFVTPKIVYPGEPSHEERLAKARALVDESDELKAFYILD